MYPSGRDLLANSIFSPLNCINYGVSGSNALTLFNATYSEGAAINANTNRFSENVTGYDKNGVSVTNEYAYDANGNLTKDSNKGITGIQYNVLNLPGSITFSDGSSITYTYAADGTKLRTVHKTGGITTTTDYCGNVIYENNTAKLLLTEEGYVSLNDNKYHYYLKDHQGNNRVVINQSGSVEEMNHYYPFGGVFASANNVQPYKYNGKEYDSRKGLNWYDYGARHYDAALGRFVTADRFAEKYSSMSIYQYGANNPANNIDVNGDSVRVHVETKDFGHSWISVGEGNNRVVYSYGRFNGTYKGQKGIHSSNSAGNGDRVLLRMTGEEANNYMSEKEALSMSSFVITDIEDSKTLRVLDEIFYSSKKMPDNSDSKYFNNPSAHIIDSYKLTSNNCTTFVSDVLNQAGSNVLESIAIQQTSTFGTYRAFSVKERFIVPASFKRFLNQISRPNGVVYKTK